MIRTLDLVRSAALATGLVFAGCMDRDLTGMDPNVQSVTSLVVPQPPSGKVDILVVVDNSGSMKEEQAALVANFPTLIDELMNPTDPANHAVTDLSVGVVTTDMGSFGYALNTCNNGALGYLGGDDGCFRNTGSVEVGGCLSSYPLFLQRNGLNAGSYPLAQMGTDFRCIATLGTNGCGAEQQMEAARRALVDQTGVGRCNAGFLRPDSILAVLWVTDEEDCSVADPRLLDPDATSEFGHPNIRCYFNEDKLKRVDDMIGQLRALRPNPRDFVMAMIVGVPRESICEGKGDELEGCLELPPMQYVLDGTATQVAPSCSSPSGFGDAYPARRFVQAAQLLGKNALVRSICNDDWRPAVRGILELIQGAVSDVCFRRMQHRRNPLRRPHVPRRPRRGRPADHDRSDRHRPAPLHHPPGRSRAGRRRDLSAHRSLGLVLRAQRPERGGLRSGPLCRGCRARAALQHAARVPLLRLPRRTPLRRRVQPRRTLLRPRPGLRRFRSVDRRYLRLLVIVVVVGREAGPHYVRKRGPPPSPRLLNTWIVTPARVNAATCTMNSPALRSGSNTASASETIRNVPPEASHR
jgi:hypothetical protein